MGDDPREKAAWPVTVRDEPEDLDDSVETEPFVRLTSQDAPGSAVNGPMQPLPRIVRSSQLPAKSPEHNTPRVGDFHRLHDERFPIPSPFGIPTVVEFERCRLALKQTIQTCFDFSYVASAVSCVLNSLRPLHTREVHTAVGLFVEYVDTKHASYDEDESAGKMWLHRCTSFLRVDEAGLVYFASAFMPQFLRKFRIRGIDATHQTIATACLIQVDLDEKSESRALARSMSYVSTSSSLAFSGYAEQNWREHCRSAEQSCQELSATACIGPSVGGPTMPRDTAKRMAANADADLATIQFEGLNLDGDDDEASDEEGDWVMV